MATYVSSKPTRFGPIYLTDGRTVVKGETFPAGQDGWPALSGNDLIDLSPAGNSWIVLVSGDPGPAPRDLVKPNLDRADGKFYDPNDDDTPIFDPASVVTTADVNGDPVPNVQVRAIVNSAGRVINFVGVTS